MKVALCFKVLTHYFFFRKSSASSGAMMLSTKVYAPVLGDFTILITFESLFEDPGDETTDG